MGTGRQDRSGSGAEGRDTAIAQRLAQNSPAAIAGTKSLVYQAAVTPTRQQLDAEEDKIIEAMHTEQFRVAVKKFTSKGK